MSFIRLFSFPSSNYSRVYCSNNNECEIRSVDQCVLRTGQTVDGLEVNDWDDTIDRSGWDEGYEPQWTWLDWGSLLLECVGMEAEGKGKEGAVVVPEVEGGAEEGAPAEEDEEEVGEEKATRPLHRNEPTPELVESDVGKCIVTSKDETEYVRTESVHCGMLTWFVCET